MNIGPQIRLSSDCAGRGGCAHCQLAEGEAHVRRFKVFPTARTRGRAGWYDAALGNVLPTTGIGTCTHIKGGNFLRSGCG